MTRVAPRVLVCAERKRRLRPIGAPENPRFTHELWPARPNSSARAELQSETTTSESDTTIGSTRARGTASATVRDGERSRVGRRPSDALTVSLDRGSGGAGGRGDAAPDARGVADPSSRPGPVAYLAAWTTTTSSSTSTTTRATRATPRVALVVPDDPDDPAARPSHASPPAAHARAQPSDPDASAPAVGSGRDDPADVDPALKLDFRSPHFDPLLALRQRPPLTTPRDVRPLDNVRKFRPFLPEGDPHRADPNASRRRRDDASVAAQALAKERAAKFREASERAKTRQPTLARILEDAKARGGPLSLLVRAQERGVRVVVVTDTRRAFAAKRARTSSPSIDISTWCCGTCGRSTRFVCGRRCPGRMGRGREPRYDSTRGNERCSRRFSGENRW